MESQLKKLIIVLADISGYTDLMVENQLSAVHGQMVVTQLIESILKEVEIPLRLQEIEGDALFLYAEHPGDEAGWRDVCAQVARKLPRFFASFAEAVVTAAESTVCRCAVCKTEGLRLKVIVHSGEAVFHRIDRFDQVSGVDVIVAHRLLKNSVPGHEYVLLTEAARRDLGADLDLELARSQEQYEGLGTIVTWVHLMGEEVEDAQRDLYATPPATLAWRGVRYAGWVIRGEFAALREQMRRPVAPVSPGRRALFAAFLVLIAPLVLCSLAIVTPIRLLLRQARHRSRLGDTSRSGA